MSQDINLYRAHILRILDQYWQAAGQRPFELTLGPFKMQVSQVAKQNPQEKQP